MNQNFDKTEKIQKIDRRKTMPHLFKKGQSGNPAGRPKGSISLTEMIKRKLLELSPDQKRTALEWLADNIIQDALEHNDSMRKLIWNYLDGLPKESLEIGGSGELPFIIKIVKDDKGTTTTEGTNSQILPPTV